MIGLLFLAFPAFEIWSLIFIGGRIGFVNTIFALLASAVLGFGLIKAQGVFLMSGFQQTLSKGQLPAAQIFFSLLAFLAGILFIIPGFLSDVIALLLILPGTKHLLAIAIRARIAKKMSDGSFRVASFGNFGGFSGGFEGFGARPRARNVSPQEIVGSDADQAVEASKEVIDVTPIRPPGSGPTGSGKD